MTAENINAIVKVLTAMGFNEFEATLKAAGDIIKVDVNREYLGLWNIRKNAFVYLRAISDRTWGLRNPRTSIGVSRKKEVIT